MSPDFAWLRLGGETRAFTEQTRQFLVATWFWLTFFVPNRPLPSCDLEAKLVRLPSKRANSWLRLGFETGVRRGRRLHGIRTRAFT